MRLTPCRFQSILRSSRDKTWYAPLQRLHPHFVYPSLVLFALSATRTRFNSQLAKSKRSSLISVAGIYNNGTVNLVNTLIGRNSSKNGSEPDCWGTLTSLGYSLIQSVNGNCMISGTLTGVLTNTNPLLGPLANVGGSTPVHTLLPGSPAINAGNPGASDGIGSHCMPTDQRGVTRPIGGRCDIGAFEGTGSVLFLPLIMK